MGTVIMHPTALNRRDEPPRVPQGEPPRVPHSKAVKWLKLAGLAALGICTVSVPLTVAIVLSTTGASDVLTLGNITPKHHHQTPAKAIADIRCAASRGHYALTFDDGPVPSTTRGLVAALSEARAVATFFDMGERAAGRSDLVELQRSVGQVANESFSAPDMTRVSQARRYEELHAAAEVLDYPNVLFRPPFGHTNAAVEADVRRTGLVPVYWTVDASDSALSAREIVQVALKVRAGGIIRLTDGRRQTTEAVAGIVAGLRARGLCPGLLAVSSRSTIGANGLRVDAIAVKP
jgi:peptidoglycan/xylan/chitin deacetylase (PgdA/CDA1 family)